MGSGGGVPVLTTERLILRAPEVGDFDSSAAMWGNEEVVRYVGGKPSTREETWARILRAHGLWSLLGYGYWVVTERASGRFVGDVGFADFHRAIEPSIDGIPEMGWVLDKWSHGRGYAGEAVAAALTWADEILKAPLTACIIAPENAASIRVADRAGFRPFAKGEYKSAPTLIFQRKRLVA